MYWFVLIHLLVPTFLVSASQSSESTPITNNLPLPTSGEVVVGIGVHIPVEAGALFLPISEETVPNAETWLLEIGSEITALFWGGLNETEASVFQTKLEEYASYYAKSVDPQRRAVIIASIVMFVTVTVVLSVVGMIINRRVLLSRLRKSNKMLDDMLSIQVEAAKLREEYGDNDRFNLKDDDVIHEIGYTPPEFTPSTVLIV